MDSNWTKRTVLALLLLVLPFPTQTDERQKFQLYNGCLAIYPGVQRLSEKETEIGLSEDAISNALESRLRSANLFPSSENNPESRRATLLFPDKFPFSHLFVRVTVLNSVFFISLEYKKFVTDDLSGVSLTNTTWEREGIGIAADAGLIMNTLAGYMDEFLVEFLRVNEPDCMK